NNSSNLSIKQSYIPSLNLFLIKHSRRLPFLINKFKIPFIKLTQTPVEFIFDRTTMLKRKDKKNLKKIFNHISCLSNGPQTTYEEILGLFTEIIIDSTYSTYDNMNTNTVTGRRTTKYKYVD
ncbi:unnamed protein product, partial [Rotaria sp. Silwood2]